MLQQMKMQTTARWAEAYCGIIKLHDLLERQGSERVNKTDFAGIKKSKKQNGSASTKTYSMFKRNEELNYVEGFM